MKRVAEKIAEARYFLEQMKRCSGDLQRSREFIYNLRAFLSAARGVGFMLRRELGRRPGFADWILQFEQDKYVSFLKQLRDEDTHVSPFRPGYVVEATSPGRAAAAIRELARAGTVPGDLSVAGFVAVTWYWTFDTHPEMPEDADPDEWEYEWRSDYGEPPPSRAAVNVCHEILAALESWLAGARKKFVTSSASGCR